MLGYKGFIKVVNGVFYPISRIKELRPHKYNSFKTNIVFDDGKIVTIYKPMIQTIELINDIKIKEV